MVGTQANPFDIVKQMAICQTNVHSFNKILTLTMHVNVKENIVKQIPTIVKQNRCEALNC